MCGRFAQQRPAAELAERFAAELLVPEPGERYNVAPTDEALVVVQREERRAVTAYRWGLIPHWATTPSAGARAFNARAETVATTPMFRDGFRKRRCLVPVDAFYEWRREGKLRLPFAIRRADGDVLALAGLWSGWRDAETGELRRTFTIVTTRSNAAIAELHDRMPVVLDPEAWATWLDGGAADPAELHGLLVPNEAVELDIYPVSRAVNDARADGPALLEPLAG
jgi:putative SOS response-associated peptidase YedK